MCCYFMTINPLTFEKFNSARPRYPKSSYDILTLDQYITDWLNVVIKIKHKVALDGKSKMVLYSIYL